MLWTHSFSQSVNAAAPQLGLAGMPKLAPVRQVHGLVGAQTTRMNRLYTLSVAVAPHLLGVLVGSGGRAVRVVRVQTGLLLVTGGDASLKERSNEINCYPQTLFAHVSLLSGRG